jgi:hypothetical protein
MNNFNPMNAPRLAREFFAAALDTEFQRLTGNGAANYFSLLEINGLFNRSQAQSASLQQFAKLLASATVTRQEVNA